MKWNFVVFLITSAAILLSAATPGVPERVVQELNMSKEQTDKIEKFYIQNEAKNLEFLTQLAIRKLELKKILLKEDNPERSIVKKAMEEIAFFEVELKLLKFDMDKEILNVLDKEQKQKYKIMRIRIFNGSKKPENKKTPGKKDK